MDNLHILTDEQLAKMAREGSETAEEILIEKYRSLVKGKTKIYFIIGADNEDVIQEGMIGLFKAVRSYEPDKEATFRTYAELCINRQILSAIKTANRLKHQPLNESLPLEKTQDDGESISAETLFTVEDNNPETLMLMKEILDYLMDENSDLFSPLERKVLGERLKGHSTSEIAHRMERDPKSIDNALQRIRKKVLAYLKK